MYLDELFKEKEKILTQAQKSQAKYQYVLEERKQLKARIQYLEKKVDSVTKQATSLENKKK